MNKKIPFIAGTLLALLIILVYLELSWGALYHYSPSQVWDVIMGRGEWAASIIVKRNAPRVVMGIIVGSSLAITGCVMQAVFRNPLASPYLLGLSSGASVGAALAILISIPFIPLLIVRPVLAFVFCFGTLILVYSMARVGGTVRTETLILSGVAVSALLSAIVSFFTYIAPKDKIEDIVFWSLGNLSMDGWVEILFILPIVSIGIVILLTQSKILNVFMLGDAHAMDLGIDVKKTRLFLLIVSSLIVSCCVAFVGVIGFVGLVIPHIFRIIIGPDNRYVMPLCVLGGGVFVVLCDYIGHLFSSWYGVIPIGVVTALIGAPFFIYLLRTRKKEVGW